MTSQEPTGVNLRGPCPSCAAPTATDQRYCVECGERLASPFNLPYPGPLAAAQNGTRFGLPMPLRLAGTLLASTLVFGVVVGTAMSTALSDQVTPPAPHVAQAPPTKPPAKKSGGPEPAPAPAPVPPVASTLGSPYAPGLLPSGGGAGKTIKPRPQIISGTVVNVNRVAGSYAVAPGGPLVAIHAKKLPEAGTRVRTPVRQLLNGTYAEDGKRKTKGRTDKATFTGTVTFRDDEPGKDYYTVSGTGSSVLVHVPPDAGGAATPPEFASAVTVGVRFDPVTSGVAPAEGQPAAPPPGPNACDADGEAVGTPSSAPTVRLSQTERTVDQTSVTTSALEGIVQAVCPGTRQLVLSADGSRESRQDSVLQVPQGIDLSKVRVGTAIAGTVELKPPDLLSLGSLASDQGIKGASSQNQVQGST